MATIRIRNTVKGQSIKANRKVGDVTISPLAYGEDTAFMEIPEGEQLQVQIGYDEGNSMLTVGLFSQKYKDGVMYYTNVSGRDVSTNTEVTGNTEYGGTLKPGNSATALMTFPTDAKLTLMTAIFDGVYTIATFNNVD